MDYLSTTADWGKSWKDIDEKELIGRDLVFVDASKNMRVRSFFDTGRGITYAAKSEGLLISPGFNSNYRLVQGLGGMLVNGIASLDSTVIAGTDGDLEFSNDEGKTWDVLTIANGLPSNNI